MSGRIYLRIHLGCSIHRFAKWRYVSGDKNQAGSKPQAGLPWHYFIRIPPAVIVGLTVIVRDFAFPAAAAREMHTSIERGMSGYRIGMQAAHRRALRYDAHVVYLRYCALIHVAILNLPHTRLQYQNQRMSTCNVGNELCYKSRGSVPNLVRYSILF